MAKLYNGYKNLERKFLAKTGFIDPRSEMEISKGNIEENLELLLQRKKQNEKQQTDTLADFNSRRETIDTFERTAIVKYYSELKTEHNELVTRIAKMRKMYGFSNKIIDTVGEAEVLVVSSVSTLNAVEALKQAVPQGHDVNQMIESIDDLNEIKSDMHFLREEIENVYSIPDELFESINEQDLLDLEERMWKNPTPDYLNPSTVGDRNYSKDTEEEWDLEYQLPSVLLNDLSVFVLNKD